MLKEAIAEAAPEEEVEARAAAAEEGRARRARRRPRSPKKKTDEQVALEVLELALQFEAKLKEKLPEVALLLGSQSTSDVTAAMDAVVTAHSFDLERGAAGGDPHPRL